MITVAVISDDGIGAPGARAVVESLRRVPARVSLFASASECGGSGTSTRPLVDARVQGAGPEQLSSEVGGAVFWQIDAPPARIALMIASAHFGPVPDCVVAGVNNGPNVGVTALHSGTVGAAIAAANVGLRAAAVSLDDVHSVDERDAGDMHWESAAIVLATITQRLLREPQGTVLNVNVPNLPFRQITGIRSAFLAPAEPDDRSILGPPRPLAGGAPRLRPNRAWPGPRASDACVLSMGSISVTPLPTFAHPPVRGSRARLRWLMRELRSAGFFQRT